MAGCAQKTAALGSCRVLQAQPPFSGIWSKQMNVLGIASIQAVTPASD